MRRAISPGGLLATLVLVASLSGAHWQPVQAAPAADPIIHIVQRGETLGLIARQYGVSWPRLVQANHLSRTTLYAGQVLIIPSGPASSIVAPPSPVATLTPTTTPQAAATYIVQRGDSLGAIVGQFGLTASDLIAANDISNPSRIFAGQQFRREPGQDTLPGQYSVLNKIPNAYGANWDLWMPNWLGLYWAGDLENGIHALPILPDGLRLWDGYLGTKVSFGCIILGITADQTLYDWASVGTPVNIQP